MKPTEEMIQEAKRQGFTVYAPEKLTTYFYIVKNDKIGYCQYDRIAGPSFCTVHKPCSHAGTGYEAQDMAGALAYKPHWADREPIHKYKNAAEFLAKHWQTLTQY